MLFASSSMDSASAAGFPLFPDGDVAIVVSTTKGYRLHSSILRRNSPYFAAELGVSTTALTSAARQEGAVRYRFELQKTAMNQIGSFQRRRISPNGEAASPNRAPLPDIENEPGTNEQNRSWDWLFGVFYGRQPEFDDHNLATVLSGCMGLVDVAESVGSVDHVRNFVDLALMQQDKTLWTSIATNPTAWAELGRRVHSPSIFTEGVIHIVGKWQSMTEEQKSDLHTDIREVCERKFKELDVAKEAIEMRILGHYPSFLCRSAASKPGRPSYANDIYMWMAICFFRQWFAQSISDGRNRLKEDGGFAFYRELAEGGQAYLDHNTFQDFHKYFPMSSKACNVLETNMAVLKEDVKTFVKDIVVERSHIKKVDFPELTWLTCAVVTKEDFPWTVPNDSMMIDAGRADVNGFREDFGSPVQTDTPTCDDRHGKGANTTVNDENSSDSYREMDAEYPADDEE